MLREHNFNQTKYFYVFIFFKLELNSTQGKLVHKTREKWPGLIYVYKGKLNSDVSVSGLSKLTWKETA